MTSDWASTMEEIRTALARYCRAIDRQDAALLRSVFHDGATIDHGAYRTSVEAFANSLDAQRDGKVIGQHTTHNLIAEQYSGDILSECYFSSVSRSVHLGETYDIQVRGRYLDWWRRRGGRLAIIDRLLVWDLVRCDKVDLEWPGPHGGHTPRFFWDGPALPRGDFTWGVCSPSDPSYAFLHRGQREECRPAAAASSRTASLSSSDVESL